MKWLAIPLLSVLLMAGCAEPFDNHVTPGQAYQFTEGLVTNDDGTPRYRVPGTEGHTSGLAWLENQVQHAGWTSRTQTFTGAEYQALDPKDQALSQWQERCGDEQSEVMDFTFHNVIAHYDHPNAETTILLGAHWESKEDAYDGGPVLGANDGASGVGVLLSLMRDYAPPGDITIVFFDGEDGFEDCHPLAGSMYYARTMTNAPDAMLLLDMVGDPNASFMREKRSSESNPELQDLLWNHGKQILPQNFIDDKRAVYDDHIPFIQEGVPSVDLIDYGDGFPPYWHTSRDTMENLDSDFMDNVQAIAQATLHDWFQTQSP